eukprot:4379803-Prymnesium_polylepis.1
MIASDWPDARASAYATSTSLFPASVIRSHKSQTTAHLQRSLTLLAGAPPGIRTTRPATTRTHGRRSGSHAPHCRATRIA